MQVRCASSEDMALAPARLLLPVRAVEPAHPSALSSASICSAAGAYPHFSLFFFHPPTHRSPPSVCARVSEAPSYRPNRHSQFRRQPNEAAPFDDLQSLYEEERGRSRYPNRNSNGETHPAQRYGRGGGNSGRPTWEPSNYAPWRSRGVSEGEAKPRYSKPWSSEARNSSSWASQTEDTPGQMHQGRLRQTMEDERGRKFDMGSRNMERTSFGRRGSAYNESETPSWERQGSFSRRGSAYNESGTPSWDRQGSFSRRGSSGPYKENGNSPREKVGSFSRRGSGGAYKESGFSPRAMQGSFSRQGSSGAYNESGKPPWEKQGSFYGRGSSGAYNESGKPPWEKLGSFNGRGSGGDYNESGKPPWEKQGSFPRQDAQRVRQSTRWQDKGRESSWEGAHTEKSSGTDGHSQRLYNGDDVAREQLSPQWSSHSRKSSSWQSSKWSGDVEEQAPLHEIGLGKKPDTSQSVKNSWPLAPHEYPLASKEWETNEEEEGEAAAEEEGYGYREAKAELRGEQDQNSSSRTDLSPIARIMERLRSIDDTAPAQGRGEGGRQSRGGLADYLTLPSAKEYLSDRSMPQPSTEEFSKGELDTRFPWEVEEEEATREEDMTVERARRLKPLSAAELTISAPELKRLRILSVHLKQRVKLGKQGVTTDLVNSIMQRFRSCEVVKVKCEGPPAGNMKKTLEILEKKTGGLIIWKAGSVAVLYRGKDFGQPVSEIVDALLAKKLESLMSTDGQEVSSNGGLSVEHDVLQEGDTDKWDDTGLISDDKSEQDSDVSLDDATKQAPSLKNKRLGPGFETIEEYAMEVEDILTDLGPRYEEWIGPEPIPVDGDLLPAVIPDYSPPYRLLPFGIKPNISNTVATHLRRLCRPLAPHFVIGRDRGLQGLASAMVKLWEKSEIAKIGIKRGILNTNQERIAEDLKLLTGGFFLCRDKRSMTFYRGNDFLPQAVSAALAERHAMAQTLQHEEETGRLDRSLKVQKSIGKSDMKPSWVHFLDPEEQIRLKKEASIARRLQIVNHIERKLKMALRKKEKAGRELEKVEERIRPVGSPDDKETVTDEERFMLRKLGLKMKAYLLVGRRGVFSGVVQNMHLHWKHRELVKIVVKEKDPLHLKEMASMLECESGGILISVDPTSKGYAMVYYRGKNYTRPSQLRPPNLLTKRLALKRSLEIQRRSSLSKHIIALEEEIVHLRAGLSKLSTDSLESSEHQVLNEEGADAHGSSKHDGASDNQPTHIQSSGLQKGLLEKQQGAVATFAEEGFNLSEDEDEMVISKISKRKLKRLCEMGPIFRAVRLLKTERHAFRNEVLNLSKAAQYLVGKSNPLSTVAKAIRLYFLDHAFIKIGVRNRPQGTSVQDIVEELEDLTGGTVYAQDDYKIVLYRGWPTGEDMPLDDLYDVLSLEQCDILEEEGDDDDDDDDDGDDEDVDAKDEDDVVKEGDNGLMLADTSVKNMKYSSAEDEDDLEWDSADGNTEDDDDEGGDDDDLRWVGLADGHAEEESVEQLTVDNMEEENLEGVDSDDDNDDDDLRWVGLEDGNAEEEGELEDGNAEDEGGLEGGNAEEEGGEGFLVDESCDKEEENQEGVDTEGRLRWDSLVLGDDPIGGISFSFDLDEDV